MNITSNQIWDTALYMCFGDGTDQTGSIP